jgi:hypothetical protein
MPVNESDLERLEHLLQDPRRGQGALRLGMSGVAIRNIRVSLRLLGYDIEPGDDYDLVLEQTVKAFQADREHAYKDGICGQGTRRLLARTLLEHPEVGKRVLRILDDPGEDTAELHKISGVLPELSGDLAVLEQLLALDVPSSLNKMRYVTEKVLQQLCARHHVSWGDAEPTIERMIGPLVSARCVPKNIAIYVRIVQLTTSPGSHFQEAGLSDAHVRIGLLGLSGFLGWVADRAQPMG